MKSLLENDLPAFYGVGRRCICDENTTSLSEFDLTEDNTQFVVGYKEGYASFCGNPFNLSVVNYDTYIGRYTGTKIAENGGYPPTQNGDIRSLFWLFSLMALQN